jgi:hypothetical protein
MYWVGGGVGGGRGRGVKGETPNSKIGSRNQNGWNFSQIGTCLSWLKFRPPGTYNGGGEGGGRENRNTVHMPIYNEEWSGCLGGGWGGDWAAQKAEKIQRK